MSLPSPQVMPARREFTAKAAPAPAVQRRPSVRRDPSFTDDIALPRKSKTGLVVGILVAGLVAAGGIGALVMMSSGSKPEAVPAPAVEVTTPKVEARPVPPPPPTNELPPATAAAATTTQAPPPEPPAATTTTKPAPPPPPTVAAAPPTHEHTSSAPPPRNTGASAPPPPPKRGGSPIVHDVPF